MDNIYTVDKTRSALQAQVNKMMEQDISMKDVIISNLYPLQYNVCKTYTSDHKFI